MVSSPPSISPILVSLTLLAGLSLDANVYSVSLCFFLCLSLILVCFDHTLFIRSQQCLSIYIVKCRICRYLVYHITCRLVFIIYFFLQFFGVLDVRIYTICLRHNTICSWMKNPCGVAVLSLYSFHSQHMSRLIRSFICQCLNIVSLVFSGLVSFPRVHVELLKPCILYS